MKLQKYTKINEYVRKLEKVKQLVFEPIYSLELVKLEILKPYIKTNLINNFIESFKLSNKIINFFN